MKKGKLGIPSKQIYRSSSGSIGIADCLMLKFFTRLLVGLGLWTYFRGRVGQYVFLILGIFLVWYAASEVEKFLKLTENESYLASLLVFKNTLYLLVVAGFVSWPFIFSNTKQKSNVKVEKSSAIKEHHDIRQKKGRRL